MEEAAIITAIAAAVAVMIWRLKR